MKIVLLSGGLDSTVVLGLVVDEFGKENVVALNMHYGQHNDIELQAAENVAEYYDVTLINIDMSTVFANMQSAMLKIQPEHDEDFYVPARNSIFLSVAAGVAESLGADEVYYGAHKEDANGYPDTTEEYLYQMSVALEEGTRNKVRIRAPFIHSDKSIIAATGKAIKAPIHLTHSCYMNQTPPCGECDTCKLRAKAFWDAGLNDPLLSLKNN